MVPFENVIATEDELRALLGTPAERAILKVRPSLDVHAREGEGETSPFAQLPNVVLTPHIGSMTAECQHAIGQRLLEIVSAFGRGELEGEVRNGELLL